MNCKEVRQYLDAYVDAELDADHMIAVDNHLDICRSCGAAAVFKRRMKGELKRLGRVEAPEELRRRVAQIAGNQTRRRRLAAAVGGAIAAAAAVALVLVVRGQLGADRQADGAVPAEGPLAELFDEMARQTARPWPMEIRSRDPNEAAQWLRDKVEFPVNPPALKLANASFEGARLSHVGALPAAQWAYLVDRHPVTLMVFDTRGRVFSGGRQVKVDGKDALVGRRNGYNVAILFDRDMACALSSDLPQERLLVLARDFCKSW